VPPLKPVAVVALPVDKEGADRTRCKAGRINRHGRFLRLSPAPAIRQALDNCNQYHVEHLVGDTAHKAIERRVIGHTLDAERGSEVGMLGEADFGFAEGSVLKAHQAQDGHQLRLCESVLGELAAVSRQHLLHHLHGRASKQYETNFSHRDHLERYRAAVKLRMSTEPAYV
jgi:hypothetical protein